MTIKKHGVSGYVEILKHSITPFGIEYLTILSEYPRFIHAQRLKHRVSSVNTSSSRAIKSDTMIENLTKNPAIPIKFGQNKSGMVSGEEINRDECIGLWHDAFLSAVEHVKKFQDMNIHKEVTNRLLEPWMKVLEVSSGTEWNNIFHLRVADDAQGDIEEWAKLIYLAKSESEPQILEHGEWHLPYIETDRNALGELRYYDDNGHLINVKTAKEISASCCAQVSYRKLNKTPEKALSIHKKLMSGDKLHATPFEHPATPMSEKEWALRKKAAEMINDDIALFKGNLRGWIQYRKEFQNENNTQEFML